MKTKYQEENGRITINGHKMEWTMIRSKGESVFGIKGSRIFSLLLKRDGLVTAQYEHGWEKQITKDDEESTLCLEHLLRTYGKEKRKGKKND